MCSARDCASRRALELVSEKWTALVVNALVGPAPPQHIDYRLSELGRTLAEPLVSLCRWAMDHLDEVGAAREAHGAPAL